MTCLCGEALHRPHSDDRCPSGLLLAHSHRGLRCPAEPRTHTLPSAPRGPPLLQLQGDQGSSASPTPTRYGPSRAPLGAGQPLQGLGGRGHVSPLPGCGPSPQPRTSTARLPPASTPPQPPLRSVPLLGSEPSHLPRGRPTRLQLPTAAPADCERGSGPNSLSARQPLPVAQNRDTKVDCIFRASYSFCEYIHAGKLGKAKRGSIK
ncbi:hypothetical protein NDU88_001210 [Pleurodeles waltl]|uniref:Uncharacterized protein n=1 Tax=Pleurodeles waltl TaxID=8319 RepID=A0AAV7WKU3_PLEWA|nr:hypothetical protein NDU88_001210 [Pleurodeles waltl]